MNCVSLGNFNVIVGFDTDQYIHIWCYDKGYNNLDTNLQTLRKSAEFQRLNKDVAKCLNNRHNQVLLPFSFWPDVYMRKGIHIMHYIRVSRIGISFHRQKFTLDYCHVLQREVTSTN